jgi:phosphoserine phosphatase RsbU/P
MPPLKVLIADDEELIRRSLTRLVSAWGYEPMPVANGRDALSVLCGDHAPHLALIDRKMPEMDGADVIRHVRNRAHRFQPYLILLTGMGNTEDLVQGLDSGADDYVVKPFNEEELRARLHVGCRVLQLQTALADKIRDLESAVDHIRVLRGIIPICAYCKSIRDDKGAWQQMEQYVRNHSEAEFSHGMCPACERKILAELDDSPG